MSVVHTVLAVLCLVAVALASSKDYKEPDSYGKRPAAEYGNYGYKSGYQSYPSQGYRGGRYYYGGKYGGKCANDGLYYRDEYSFVICSNGNSYVQPCAPGTRNSGHHNYAPGYYYGYSDFCDVNLVDYGYAAGYASYQPYSGKDSYGAGYDSKAAYPADKVVVKKEYGYEKSYDKPAYVEPAYGKKVVKKEYAYEQKEY